MASRAHADNIEAERERLDKLPRLGHPPPTQFSYEETMFAPPDTITMTIACIGLNINREAYEALGDYCRSELTEHDISPECMELFIFILRRPRRDPRFSFLGDNTIPYDWMAWALEGTLIKVKEWTLENEHGSDKAKRERTRDHSEEGGGDSVSGSKKQKTVPSSPDDLMSDGDI